MSTASLARPACIGYHGARGGHAVSVLLLVDYENLRDSLGRPPDLGALVEFAARYGPIAACRAYGEWPDVSERLAIYKLGVESVFVPPVRGAGDSATKSLVMTALVADAVDSLHSLGPKVLVLASSDKELLPLVRLAKLRGARVVVVAGDQPVPILEETADEYVPYRTILGEKAKPPEEKAAVPEEKRRPRRRRRSGRRAIEAEAVPAE